jgi:outer membrane immunogenic protein
MQSYFLVYFGSWTSSVARHPTATSVKFNPLNGTAATYGAKIEWVGTVRGRLGVLITDQVLLYGTGGLAYSRVSPGNIGMNGVLQSVLPPVLVPYTGTALNASKTNIGFAVGGGIEGKCSYWLPTRWMWKLEYLYVDLGSLDTVSSFALTQSIFVGGNFTGPITTHTHFTDNIVRVGLNYQFH